MAYGAEISRANPTLIVLLLDQSRSMANPFGTGEVKVPKAQFLADVVNRTLHDLVIRSSKAEAVRDYYSVAVLGYGVGRGGVKPVLSGPLAGQPVVRISDVADNPARLEKRIKRVAGREGQLTEQTVSFPIWLDAHALNDTPMCAGLHAVYDLLASWLQERRRCFPPVVLHITDGGSTDGDPTNLAQSIKSLGSDDGDVLLFNCHLGSDSSLKVEYPADANTVPDYRAQRLFWMSSVLPDPFIAAATASRVSVRAGSRGFVMNADPASLVQFFEIGTRPGNLR